MDRWGAFRFLCTALQPCLGRPPAVPGAADLDAADPDVDWPLILEFADAHRVTTALACTFKDDARVPADLREVLQAIHTLNTERNDAVCRSLHHVLKTVGEAGCDAVVLKGAASLAERLYPDPAARLMTDIDILVAEPQAAAALAALKRAGWDFAYTKSAYMGAATTMAPLIHPDHRVDIDLHMHLVTPEYRGIVGADDAFRAARRVETGGGPVRVLGRAHRIAHTVINSQLHDNLHALGRVELRRLLEFAMLLRDADAAVGQAVEAAFRRAGRLQVLRRYAALAAALLDQPGPFAPPAHDPLPALRQWVEDPTPRSMSLGAILGRDLARIAAEPRLLLYALRPRTWRVRAGQWRRPPPPPGC
jgi:hypothetical protein